MLALASAFIGCKQSDEKSISFERRISQVIAARRAPRMEPVAVEVVSVTDAGGVSPVSYVGRVEPAKTTTVTLPHGGTLISVRVREGQRVHKGEVLAEVRNESLQSAYDVSVSTLRQAEDGFARVQKVFDSGTVTAQKYEEVKAQLERARAAERGARSSLEDCIVRAPFAGIVSEVTAHQGEQVSALAPLVRLVDVGRLEITFAVPEGELSTLALGDSAVVTVPAIAQTFPATLTVKGVVGSMLSHSYDCTLGGLPDVEGLLPGMVCKVALMRAEQAAGVLVPASALMNDVAGRYVWTADSNDVVAKQRVVVDGFSGRDVIVREGLRAGDRVIFKGSQKVSTGMKVKVSEGK